MCSRFPESLSATWAGPLKAMLVCLMAALTLPASAQQANGEAQAVDQPPLRVCADPDNLPFSSRDEAGFENRIARLLAQELGRPLQYTWLRDRRGFIRKTLGAGLCDLIIGVPVDLRAVDTTVPYYRTGFYFVGRTGSKPLRSFTDARLPDMRIGVQLIGIDPGTSPVAYALARHGANRRVVGYTLTEDDRPPAQRMIEAVAAGTLDSALIWGPQAGYFARQSREPLRLDLAQAPPDLADIPFEFAIAMGTRHGDDALRQSVNGFLQRQREHIDAILDQYSVPRTDTGEARP